MRKPSIKVSLSSSFPARTKCVQCGNKLMQYSILATFYADHPHDQFYKDYQTHSSIDRNRAFWIYFSIHNPRLAIWSKMLRVEEEGLGYKPRKHHIRNIGEYSGDAVFCKCCNHMWVITNSSDRKEVSNRKAKYDYPDYLFK